MKKYSARRVGLGARNLFRSGGGRTEVRAPVGLRRCRSEATVPYRRLGVSKSTVDSHFPGNLPTSTPAAVELSQLRRTWSAEFIPLLADLHVPRGGGLKSALLNSRAVPRNQPSTNPSPARASRACPRL